MTKRPWELLPVPLPSQFDPSVEEPDYFYQNIVKPLIPDFIKLMANGIHVDQSAVDDLRVTIDEVLQKVSDTLSANSIIQDFQAQEYPKVFAAYKEEQEASMRTLDVYIKEYKPDNKIHRTYLVNAHLKAIGQEEYLSSDWKVNDLKKLNGILEDKFLDKVLSKSITATHPLAIEAMELIAEEKLRIWNKVRLDKISEATQDKLLPPFNPGSSDQKHKLLTDMYGFESGMLGDAYKDYEKQLNYLERSHKFEEMKLLVPPKNKWKWGRDQIEELLRKSDNPAFTELLEAFVDHSYSAIIKNNFLEAFDRFTIDGVLHGNFKLFGAKTFRPTSNSPNMLNAPSTGSIYAKPLKKCFIAPPGYKVWAIDYSALEDRVIANLSQDENKLAVFTEGIDGHSLGATYYFPAEVTAIVGEYTDNKQAARDLKAAVDSGNKEAKELRQKGKPVTFKLAYGGYPDADKGGFITQEIFDAYHNEMYPSISAMRDAEMDKAEEQGYLHLGLGCRIMSDDVRKDSLTLFNSLSQFWSVLTIIALNELNYHIEQSSMQTAVMPNSTIYDAIYGIVKDDSESIKWLNDTITPIMSQDFLEGQIVHNEANLEIGDSWADLVELPNNASLEQIQGVLDG